MARVRRHPRLTSFVVRFLAIIATLALLDRLVPGLSFLVRVVVAVVVSLVVGALLERTLGTTPPPGRTGDPRR